MPELPLEFKRQNSDKTAKICAFSESLVFRDTGRKEFMTKFIFITGGVVSSLGKGIAASSLAAILEDRGLKVTITKLDPYINVDPGTMSPFQHGDRKSVV